MRSWDRFEVPIPFTRGLFLYGHPLTVPRHATAETLEQFRQMLEHQLLALSEDAEKEFEAFWKRGIARRVDLGPQRSRTRKEDQK